MMAAAPEAQASDTVAQGPRVPNSAASRKATAAGETSPGASADARACSALISRDSSSPWSRADARASATSVSKSGRPVSAPTKTPIRSAGVLFSPAASHASRAAGSANERRRSGAPGGTRSIAAAWEEGKPVASKTRTGCTAEAPSASAAHV